MPAAKTVKKKKQLTYQGKPIFRVGNTVYYGNLEDRYILVLEILEEKPCKDIATATKIVLKLMDNQGTFGEGQVFRKTERDNFYKAFDIGTWWLQEALTIA